MRFTGSICALLAAVPLGAQNNRALPLERQFDAAIDSVYKPSDPGGVVLVSRNGKVIYERAFGMANVEWQAPMPKDAVFAIASITKQFTAVAILQQVEKGALSLNDTVGKFLPDYPAHLKGITIEQLLTHTAGVPAGKGPGSLLALGRGWLTAAEVMATFKDDPLDFPPGTRMAYSNTGYQLLGYLLEKVTGKPYPEFIQETLLKPAGMTSSFYGDDTRVARHRAAPYLFTRHGLQNAAIGNVQVAFAAGAIQSTAQDFLRWHRALLSGKFISRAMLEKAWTPARLKDGTVTDYGYGWFIGELQGSPIVEHGGNMGGFMSHAIYLPREDVLVEVFLNSRGKRLPELIATDIAAAAIGRPFAFRPVVLDSALLQSYAGKYRNPENIDVVIGTDNGKLYYHRAGGTRLIMMPYAKDKFLFENTSIIGEFQRDPAGKITGLATQLTRRTTKNLVIRTDGTQSTVTNTSPGSVDPGLSSRVDSLFAQWRTPGSPGCAIGVSHRGRVVLERAYGMADVESGAPMTPSTVVHAASVAKSFTAMAVLLLARDGKLALDDDIRRYLPELPDYKARYGTPVTIRQLLNHTSGLKDFFELLILGRGRFEEERITDAEAMAVIGRQLSLNFPPGTQYGYSNTGYLLAAHIVERVSGERFSAFAAKRIFAPLGLTNTRFRDDFTTLVPGRALGYARRGTEWRTSVPNYDVAGSTNLLTTVGDLLRWAQNLAHPVVGDSSIVRQMLTPAVLAGGDTTQYGLGLSLITDRGISVAEHEGRDPGFRAYLGWYREPGIAVALLCNAAALNPVGLGRQVAGMALALPAEAPRPAPAASPTVADDTRQALKWAGVWFEPSTRQVAELTVRDGVLYTDRQSGARVEAINARRARLVNQPLELEFAPDSRSYHVRWLIPGRRADMFELRAPAAPRLARPALAAYAGTYEGVELDSRYRVEAGDSTLMLRARAGTGLEARPVFADAFVSGQYTIQFVRKNGRVSGFEISHPRARGVKFVKLSY